KPFHPIDATARRTRARAHTHVDPQPRTASMTDEGRSTMDHALSPTATGQGLEASTARRPAPARERAVRGVSATAAEPPYLNFLRGSSGDPTDPEKSAGVPGPDSARHKACAGR